MEVQAHQCPDCREALHMMGIVDLRTMTACTKYWVACCQCATQFEFSPQLSEDGVGPDRIVAREPLF